MSLSIQLSEEEKTLADRYAKRHGMSPEEAIKKALFEKIEDEYDISIVEDAYREYVDNGKKSRPINKLWGELNIGNTKVKDTSI